MNDRLLWFCAGVASTVAAVLFIEEYEYRREERLRESPYSWIPSEESLKKEGE